MTERKRRVRPVAALPVPANRLATSPQLEFDTRVSEQTLRPQIHGYLDGAGLVTPDSLRDWLFREVLHVDLKDPHLGLGDLLLDSDPFEKRDH